MVNKDSKKNALMDEVIKLMITSQKGLFIKFKKPILKIFSAYEYYWIYYICHSVIERTPLISWLNKTGILKDESLVPRVFYVGLGKTGSSSISIGIKENCTHWHNRDHIKILYKTSILEDNDISLYDFIMYIGEKYNFKPLIVESYRELVSRCISTTLENLDTQNTDIKDYKTFIDNIKIDEKDIGPYSLKWKEYFGVDIVKDFNKEKGFYYKELDNVKLLFLKFDKIKEWNNIFKEIGYVYKPIWANNSNKKHQYDLYREVLQKYKVPLDKLNKIYNYPVVQAIYTPEEIKKFKNRWSE